MSKRPTPETDAVWADTSQNILEHARRLERQRDDLLDQLTSLELRMPAELARLERERNEARVLLAQYIPGDGCECEAHNESECGCGVDWTPTRQKELEAEVAELREKVKRIKAQLHAAMWYIRSNRKKQNQLNP